MTMITAEGRKVKRIQYGAMLKNNTGEARLNLCNVCVFLCMKGGAVDKEKHTDGGKGPSRIGANAEAVSLKLIRLKDGREIYIGSVQRSRKE